MTSLDIRQIIDDRFYWRHQTRSPRVMLKQERKRVHRKVGVKIEDAMWRFVEDAEMEICIMGRING